MGSIRAALDACVIYPAAVRDTLLGAVLDGLFVPSWSSQALAEATRNLIADGRMTERTATRTVEAIRDKFPTAEVFDALIPGDLPGVPSDDRHIAEAAVTAQASHLVTLNLKHFPV
jgi:hypothetical protein